MKTSTQTLAALTLALTILLGCDKMQNKKTVKTKEELKVERYKNSLTDILVGDSITTAGYNKAVLTNINTVLFPLFKDLNQGSEIFFYNHDMKYYNQTYNHQHSGFTPGFSVINARSNIINATIYNKTSNMNKSFFKNPVLVNSIYYPKLKDQYDQNPDRNYYMVSAYDEDTNKDGVINANDLRRFYYFNQDLTIKENLVPKNYSVIKSEYDIVSDYMYVYAMQDANNDGAIRLEPRAVFYINLKDPTDRGKVL